MEDKLKLELTPNEHIMEADTELGRLERHDYTLDSGDLAGLVELQLCALIAIGHALTAIAINTRKER